MSLLPDYRLAVTFQEGTNGIVDFLSVLTARECGIFEALKDKACFDQARLELNLLSEQHWVCPVLFLPMGASVRHPM